MLRHALLKLIRCSMGISRAKSNESNSLTETESPTGIMSRKSVVDDATVADLNWDHELLLMKGMNVMSESSHYHLHLN